jgi:IS5 family transposase
VISLRCKHKKESKLLLRETYNGQHPKRAKKAKERLKTIAHAHLRELNRKMSKTQRAFYKEKLELYQHAVNQQKTDKNKVYSLHKPFTECIAKGKPHRQYEFGNKVGLGGKKARRLYWQSVDLSEIHLTDTQ